jgi:hypothetical protein
MKAVVISYIEKLSSDGVMPTDVLDLSGPSSVAGYALQSCFDILQLLESRRWDAASRRCGFTQALLVVIGVYTVGEITQHNLEEDEEGYTRAAFEVTITLPTEFSRDECSSAIRSMLTTDEFHELHGIVRLEDVIPIEEVDGG